MKSVKDIVLIGIYTALLICSQFALSFVSGVEIVSALFCVFCFYFSIYRGIFLGLTFSFLRCLIFGFYPSVLVLYLVYYTLFAFLIGLLGKIFRRSYSIKSHIFVVISVAILTIIFTLLDDIITPLFYGIKGDAFYGYFLYSLPVMWTQVLSASISTLILFPFILKLFDLIFNKEKR